MRLKDYIYMPYKSIAWRRKNKHNRTKLHSNIDIEMVDVGNYTYGPINILSDNNLSKLHIGHYCSIGPETLFVLNSEHDYKTFSTYPFKTICLDDKTNEAESKGDIWVDDDVWIGTRATIMSGVHIGQGAVIGACALVTKDVPPYSIVGGVPAKIIKYRFDEEVIDKLKQMDYSKLTKENIINNIDLIYKQIEDVNDVQITNIFKE